MSLVQRIPPLVSALAFGYGVGMAAPQSTIASMQAAVDGHHQTVAPSAPAAPGAPALTAPVALRSAVQRAAPPAAGGDESRELSRLRDAEAREGGRAAACDLDRPNYSRRPRYESRVDRDVDDVDDLDTAGAEALSRLQLPDLNVPVTRRTLKYVRFFTRTDRGRGMFETWLKRSGRYQDMIQAELRDRRLPEDLIWVAMIESGFDARAKSPAGAVGLWQFMPATGAVYGLQQSRHLDQRKNPRLATMAAAHHLRDLYMRFGAWELALAAYNMGYEQLLDAIDSYGTSDFNELARQQAIPSETAAYVPKIAAAAIVANNLERFGFDRVDVVRPVDAAEIAVPPGTPLRTLAKAAGVSTATVRTLNPDVLGERVPPGRGDFLLLIPADTLAKAQASLPHLLDTEVVATDDASVLDPVDLIGGREPIKRQRARSEDDSLLSLLPPPKRRRSLRDPLADQGDDRADDDRADDDEEIEAPRRILPRRRKGREAMLYKVGPGDTLLGVARQFAIDVDDIARDNHLDGDAKLRVGALLKLRVKREMIGDAAEPADAPLREPASRLKPEIAGDAEPLLKKEHKGEGASAGKRRGRDRG